MKEVIIPDNIMSQIEMMQTMGYIMVGLLILLAIVLVYKILENDKKIGIAMEQLIKHLEKKKPYL